MEDKMSLQEIYFISEMVVGVAVIISIVFVAVELRQNTYMLRKYQTVRTPTLETFIVDWIRTGTA
jgi:hypothetical protein